MKMYQGCGIGACGGVCGKKRGRKRKGDTWWWNEVVEATKSHRDYV